MNAAMKKKIIRELIGNVQRDVLAKVPQMPEEWDGIEIRQYLADKFSESSLMMGRKDLLKRLRSYRNEVLVRNL